MQKVIDSLAVNANTTYQVLDTDQTPAVVSDDNRITITIGVTGASASAVGAVIVNLGLNSIVGWDTEPFISLSIPANGTTQARKTFLVEVGGGRQIKVLSIENQCPDSITVDDVTVLRG